MQKTAPSFARLAGMALFALSCFAIVLFLWKSFGGPSPLAPAEYRFTADFPEATQLAEAADVRISGASTSRPMSGPRWWPTTSLSSFACDQPDASPADQRSGKLAIARPSLCLIARRQDLRRPFLCFGSSKSPQQHP